LLRGRANPARRRNKIGGGKIMAKFLITASYSAEGLQGLHKDKATGRRNAVRQALESVGGKLESMHYALAEFDVVIIAELPDVVAASAVSLAASATGLIRTRTIALMTVEETNKALSTALKFRAPGG
jgi:uncharacterized protein with GYD domain